MAKQIIISISREFGSAGHEIAEKLAKELGIDLCDRSLLDELAKEKNSSAEKLAEFDEKPISFLAKRIGDHTNSAENIVAQMQFDYIRKKADSGDSFVVVGRCAETVLAGRENFYRFFILGNCEEKRRHVEVKYNLSEQEALEKMLRHDKKRKQYHNQYSDYKWGDSRGYDMCINSSKLGVDGTVKMILDYVNSVHKD